MKKDIVVGINRYSTFMHSSVTCLMKIVYNKGIFIMRIVEESIQGESRF